MVIDMNSVGSHDAISLIMDAKTFNVIAATSNVMKQKYLIKSCSDFPAIISKQDQDYYYSGTQASSFDPLSQLGILRTNDMSIKILKYPQYGNFEEMNGYDGYIKNELFKYKPNLGFIGQDKFVAQVIIKNVEYIVDVTMAVYPGNFDGYNDPPIGECVNKLKINKPKIFKVSFADESIQFAELAPQTLGLTTDNGDGTKTITLDDNGAGYGWYRTGADVASMLKRWSSQMALMFRDS